MKDIMNADKYSVDYNCGENNLYREGLEFDTAVQTGSLTEDMPKKQTKPTVTGEIDRLAGDMSLYS